MGSARRGENFPFQHASRSHFACPYLHLHFNLPRRPTSKLARDWSQWSGPPRVTSGLPIPPDKYPFGTRDTMISVQRVV